ncbi:unnamed protein product [Dicrocoelium dendriticum]|nr:unnamed protein product [Dicrocoelium dendriticum]
MSFLIIFSYRAAEQTCFSSLCSECNKDQIAIRIQLGRWQVLGSNMVITLSNMKYLFIPAKMSPLFEFLFACYSWVAEPSDGGAYEADVYVSNFRTTRDVDINKALLAESSKRFLQKAFPGSLYVIWESRNSMVRVVRIVPRLSHNAEVIRQFERT